MTETLDILSFGAHPDDVEIGMAGTLIHHANMGYKTGVCDLTLAEMSSNGNVNIRQEEANEASKWLGLKERMNLALPDRGLTVNEDSLEKVVQVIRKYKPGTIFMPYPIDRHPDHGNCTKLVEEAVFSAGIRRYEVNGSFPAHRVDQVYYYFINRYDHPHFTIDISAVIEDKKKSLQSYKSQFMTTEDGVETPLNNGYIDTVLARDMVFGKEVGVRYAEGFRSKRPMIIDDLIGARI